MKRTYLEDFTMSSETACRPLCAFCWVFVVPFAFQTIGFFTPKWASNATCDSIGLLYSCCTGSDNKTCGNTNGGDELDVRALGLLATSFALMVLAMLSLCCGIANVLGVCHKCNVQSDGARVDMFHKICDNILGAIFEWFACLFVLIAGIFSFIGCIIVSTKFATSKLGYSFYLSLIGSCLIILSVVIACYLECKDRRRDYDSLPDSPSDISKGAAFTQRISTLMNKSAIRKSSGTNGPI